MTTPRRTLESLAVLAMPLLLAAALAGAFLQVPADQRADVLAAVARAGWPLFLLFSVLIVVSVLLYAVMRSRRRSALLAICLLFSAALHLLTASLLSLWVIQQIQREAPVETGRQRVELGLPSSSEGAISQEVRERLLESRVTDARTLEASRTEQAVADVNVERQRADVATQPDRQPLTAAVPSPEVSPARPASVDARVDAKMQAQDSVDATVLAQARPAETPAAHTPDTEAMRADRRVDATPQRLQPATAETSERLTADVRTPDRQPKPEDLQVAAQPTDRARPQDDLRSSQVRTEPTALPMAAAAVPTAQSEAPSPRTEIRPKDVRADRAAGATPEGAAANPERPAADVRLDTATETARSLVATVPNVTPRESRVREQVQVHRAVPREAVRRDVLPAPDVAAELAAASPGGADQVARQAPQTDVNAARRSPSPVPEASREAAARAPAAAERPVASTSMADADARPVASPRAAAGESAEPLAAASPARTAGEKLTGIARRLATLLTGPGPQRDSEAPRGAVEVTAERNPGTPVEAAQAPAPAPVRLAAAVSPSAERPMVTEEARVESLRTAAGRDAGETLGTRASTVPRPSPSVLDVGAIAPAPAPHPSDAAGHPANSGAGSGAYAAVAPGYTRQVDGTPVGPVASRPADGLTASDTKPLASFARSAAATTAETRTAVPGSAESIAAAPPPRPDVAPMAGAVGSVRAADAPAAQASAAAAGTVPVGARTDLTVARAAGGAPADMGSVSAPRADPTGGAASTSRTASETLAGEAAPMEIGRRRDVSAGLDAAARPVAPGAVALNVAARSASIAATGGSSAPAADGPAGDRSDAMAGSRVERARLSPSASEAALPAPASAGGAGLDASARGPAAMEVSVPSASESRALTPTDITTPTGSARLHKSLIAAGSPPPPESVPDKAIYQMRKPEKRRQYISELGGSPATEQAVEAALDWLAKVQSDDGRWDIDGFKTVRQSGGAGDRIDADVAITGLSLLAYLGAGYTHADGKHKETVLKALDWVIGGQKPDGDLRRGGQMYDQAMAAAALCEALSLTGDERLRPPAELAIRFILQAQTPESGWRYQPHEDSDTSVTGWQVLAMKSALIAGIAIPQQHLHWTGMWLDQVRKGEEGGLYIYKPGHAVTPVMTAEGWFCQMFMGTAGRARGQQESVRYLMENPPAWNPIERGAINMYYWYYATLALHLSGVPQFRDWNAGLTAALLQGRVKEGPAAGSWEPSCLLAERGGRLYTTVMGCLCLEVYYRFMPLYQAAP